MIPMRRVLLRMSSGGSSSFHCQNNFHCQLCENVDRFVILCRSSNPQDNSLITQQQQAAALIWGD